MRSCLLVVVPPLALAALFSHGHVHGYILPKAACIRGLCKRAHVDCPSRTPRHNFFGYHRQIHCRSLSPLEGESPLNENGIQFIQRLSLFTPLWTVIAAAVGMTFSNTIAPTLGSVQVVSKSLFLLMLVMAISTTPDEFSRALQNPKILVMNAVGCFGLMPLLGILVARLVRCDHSQTIGTILLGCVCGGQASNLFALLAGGDVSLSVICTLSTTIMGVVATPILAKLLLSGSSVVVDGVAVLYSVVTLVLGPLLLGLGLGRVASKLVQKLKYTYPVAGIGATLCLVAGGAANSARVSFGVKAALASVLLPILGGLTVFISVKSLPERSKRTLVIEVLSKSPTLAYVLALKHFDDTAATVPAAGMVSLAMVGALVASIWSLIPVQEGDVQETLQNS